MVKAFVSEDLAQAKFGARADAMQEMAFQAAFLVAFLSPLLQDRPVGRRFAIWFGGNQVLAANGLNLGELVAFTQYMAMVVTPLAMMAIVVPFILRGEASAARLVEAYDAEPLVEDKPDAQAIDPADIKGRVVFDDVSFAFRRAGRHARSAGAQEHQPDHRARRTRRHPGGDRARARRRWSTCCRASTM